MKYGEIELEPGSAAYEHFFGGISNSKDTEPSIQYNVELLNYAGVLEVSTEFTKSIVSIVAVIMLIVSLVSITMLYTTYKMTYSERIREFGMLRSIGMDKKQIKLMIRKEVVLIGIVGIALGIVMGLIISMFLTSIINIFLKNYAYNLINLSDNLLLNRPKFIMKFNNSILILTGIIVYIVISIASKLSLRNINKLNPIDAINNVSTIKNTKKQLKISSFIEKTCGIEGVMAYKNIKRDKVRYKIISLSLIISIIMFLSISGIVQNFYKSDMYGYLLSYLDLDIFEDCQISFSSNSINQKEIYKVANYLENKGLIKEFCIYKLEKNVNMKVDRNKNTENLKNMISKGIVIEEENGEINVPTSVICYYDEAYNAILKKIGISNLLDDEIVLMDTIKGKNNEKFRLTNYKKGDSCIITINGVSRKVRIAEIVDDFSPFILECSKNCDIYSPRIILLSKDNILKEDSYLYLALDTDKFYEIGEKIESLSNLVGEELNFSRTKIIAESAKAQKSITEIIVNCLIVLFGIISFINIFNTIFSSILLRKKEFAVLNSIGMSIKQINKMLFLEGIFYGIASMFFGIIISFIILLLSYQKLKINTNLYPFTIPWLNIFICIIIIYSIIFFSIISARKKIKEENIIEQVKNENL